MHTRLRVALLLLIFHQLNFSSFYYKIMISPDPCHILLKPLMSHMLNLTLHQKNLTKADSYHATPERLLTLLTSDLAEELEYQPYQHLNY